MEGLEAKHRARDPLNETVVLFDDVVQIFDLQDLDGAPKSLELKDHVDTL